MERVTVAPIDLGKGTDFKGTVSTPSDNFPKNDKGFSLLLAKKIQRDDSSQNIKSGKEATNRGKEVVSKQKDQNNIKADPQNKQDDKIDNTNAELNKKIDTADSSDKTALANEEQVFAEQQNIAKDKNTISAEEQSELSQSELLLSLLQSSDQISTEVRSKEVDNTALQLVQVLDNTEPVQVADNVLAASSQQSIKSMIANEGKLPLTKAEQAVLNTNNNAIQINAIQVNGEQVVLSSTDGEKSIALTDDLLAVSAEVDELLQKNKQVLGELINDSKLAKNTSDKVVDKVSMLAANNDSVLSEINKNANEVKASIDLAKIGEQLSRGEPLTPEQLALLAQLKTLKQNKPNGETPPIIVNKPVTSLVNTTNAFTENTSNDDQADLQQTEQLLTDKTVTETTKNKEAFDFKQLAQATLAKSTADFSLTNQLGVENQNNTMAYSDSEQRDIQTLHAASAKVTELNNQNQKTTMFNQIDTLSIHRKDFTSALQDKVMIMVQQKIRQVDIRLDPPELGQMHVKLNLNNDQATVQFIVQNQQAKEVLDQNMSKLKDMLAQQGVDVGDANVGHQNSQTADEQTELAQQKASFSNIDNIEEEAFDNNSQLFTTNMVKGSAVGVDYYA